MARRKILGEETVCPKCGDALRMDVNVGDGYLHDVCFGCGSKRKKIVEGQVEEIEQKDE